MVQRAAILALATVLVIVSLVALAGWGSTHTRSVIRPISYWVVDDRTLGVLVLDGRIGGSCAITQVEETAATIRVRAECDQPWLSLGGTAALQRHEFTVALDADLADRAIVDGNGEVAERCRKAGCP